MGELQQFATEGSEGYGGRSPESPACRLNKDCSRSGPFGRRFRRNPRDASPLSVGPIGLKLIDRSTSTRSATPERAPIGSDPIDRSTPTRSAASAQPGQSDKPQSADPTRRIEAGDLVPAVSKFEAYNAVIHYGPGFLRTIEPNISYTPTSAD